MCTSATIVIWLKRKSFRAEACETLGTSRAQETRVTACTVHTGIFTCVSYMQKSSGIII